MKIDLGDDTYTYNGQAYGPDTVDVADKDTADALKAAVKRRQDALGAQSAPADVQASALGQQTQQTPTQQTPVETDPPQA